MSTETIATLLHGRLGRAPTVTQLDGDHDL